MDSLNNILKKNKGKVAIMLSVLLTGGIGIGLYYTTKYNSKDPVIQQKVVDKSYRLADYIITGNDIGYIRLLNTKDGEELFSIDLKQKTDSRYTYLADKDLDKVYVYGTLENTFYEITADKNKLNANKFIQPKEAIDFDTFKAEGDYILARSKDKKILTKFSKDGSTKEYKVGEEVNDYILTDNTLIYSTNNHINRVNLINGETKKVEVGDKTIGLFSVKTDVIAFNKFGSGLNQSIALRLNPKDLYIKNMYKFDSANIKAITPDSDDDKLVYTEVINEDTSPLQIITVVNEHDFSKEKSNIKVETNAENIKYNTDTSIASKGYIYNHNGNKLEVIDIRSEQLKNSIEVGEIFVTPIIK